MQNTVIEHKALALSGNVYFNSTTKYVKTAPTTATQTLPPPQSALVKTNHQQQSTIHLSSIILKSSPTRGNQQLQRTLNKKSPEKEQAGKMEAGQLAAINLSANIFMNATTRFVKGFANLLPVNLNGSKSLQKKSLSEGKQQKLSPKKTLDPEPSIYSIKPQRTPQKNAIDVAAANYMSSTTKYVKPSTNSSVIDAAKGKIEKIVRNRPHQANIQNQGKILSRDKVSPVKSVSSSESKVQRRRDRTRELKFLEKKPQDVANVKESTVAVKNRTSSIDLDFQTRRNDTKIQLKAKPEPKPTVSIINSYRTNDSKKQISPQTSTIVKQEVKPSLNRIQRPTVAEAQSADKIPEVTEEVTRLFVRQQQTRPQLIKHTQTVKSATILPSGQLPLETPIKPKLQSFKAINKEEIRPIGKTHQNIQISTIKEEKSSALQNTKTTISNKRSINNPKEDISIHVQQNSAQSASYKFQQSPKVVKQQSSRIIKKEENTEVLQNNYSVNRINSAKNIKPVEKVEQPVQPRPTIKRQQVQPVKQSISQTRRTTTSSFFEEKKPYQKSEKVIQTKVSRKLVQNRSSIKTEKSQKGSKTSIEQPIIDNSVRKATNVPQSRVVQPIHSKSPLYKHQQPVINNNKAEQSSGTKQLTPKEAPKPIQVKSGSIKSVSHQETAKKQSTIKKSFVLAQVLHKFYIRLLSKALESVLNKSKSSKVHSKQASILVFAAANTFNIYEKSIKMRFFEQIKRLPSLKQQIKRQINPNIHKQTAAILIFRVLVSKEREYFELLKRNRSFTLTPNVQNLSKKSAKKSQSNNKPLILQQIRRIIQSYWKKQVQRGYNKVLFFNASNLKKSIKKQPILQQTRSPPKYTIPSRDYQAEKQSSLQARNQLQCIVSSIQSRMTDRKRYSDLQKSKLIKKQQELTNKIKATYAQVLQRKKLNKQRKSQLQSLGQRQDLDISLPQYQPLIGLLTEIYSAIFSKNDEKVNKEALVKKYQLNKQDHNSLLDEWSCLTQNARLKYELVRWQGGDPFGKYSSESRREGEVLSSAMRNLIRERYLWEWVKLNAQKL